MGESLRTAGGAYIDFDVKGDHFVMNILGGAQTVHVSMSNANMEEFMDLIGKVYYDAVEEDSSTFMKRLMKEAIREERMESLQRQAEVDRRREEQQRDAFRLLEIPE